MTPSLSGLIASMVPGVLPSIAFASAPTATTVFVGLPFSLRSATTEGSLRTTPLPLAYTSVLAVPRSIERSFEKYPIILFNISYLKKN